MTREAKAAVVSILLSLSPLGCASRQVSPHVATGVETPRDFPRVVQAANVLVPADLAGQACTVGAYSFIEAVVGIDGRVHRARIYKTSGAPSLDTACLVSAYQWAFEPSSQAGRPASATVQITCRLECR